MKALPIDVCQGEISPKHQENKKTQQNKQLTLLDWQGGKNLEKTPPKKKRPIERAWEAGQGTCGDFLFFFLFVCLVFPCVLTLLGQSGKKKSKKQKKEPKKELGCDVWDYASD